MIEILFRGKDEFGNWHYGSAMQWNGHAQIIKHHHMVNSIWQTESVRVIPETVGQFIGQIGSMRVFEGDIDRSGYVIKWSDDKCLFALYNNKGYIMGYPMRLIELCIVGNTTDNPELLK